MRTLNKKSAIFLTALYSIFGIFCGNFCLWIISDYLLNDPILALFFLPCSLRLGIVLHIPRRFWAIPYVCEWLLIGLLWHTYPNLSVQWLYVLSLLSYLVCFKAFPYYTGTQWQKLSLQGGFIFIISLLNASLLAPTNHFGYTFLVSLTGGLLVVPACYLIYEYLFKHRWIPLTADLIHKPISLRTRHIFIYLFLFILNIYIQTTLPSEFMRFAIFCLAIPIILLAFHYGWQGALLGTLLNSIALIATSHGFSNVEMTDLLLSLSAQTVTGIFLGLAIQYQRDLNHSISIELSKNKWLTTQLIDTEETIRKEIARELHDEIGQNITAIRTQANILKRLKQSEATTKVADLIEALSLNVYDTTKSLLNRLRPKSLDDLGLQQSIQDLFLTLGFEKQHIQTDFAWHNPQDVILDHVTEMTLYRLCQESLNNIIKHAQASHIKLSLSVTNSIFLSIEDNGIGMDPTHYFNGFGIKGMRERVKLLGGDFQLHAELGQGTIITIRLPLR
ncbi:signal transduction histidine-protein kinase/phosphatase UhpB [Conservatibacter flavescens]|uniref:Oxygen sensor histidine kinase NreB n=2 Tax=Conservatibacter flavescens TaxID=28161 RepID=A0A2M8S4B1_9PAST|nr:signal transduction histidine-protein kinase/phosphatase UhpB [Conservatibacter flavescens]